MVLNTSAPLSQRYHKYIENQRQRVRNVYHNVNQNEQYLHDMLSKLNEDINSLQDNEVSRQRNAISKLQKRIDKSMNKLTRMIEAISQFTNDREDVVYEELYHDEYYSDS